MAFYFASDLHLRVDRPDRGQRLARFLASLTPDDTLTIVGDLCDFWFASRRKRGDETRCPGLAALSEFRRNGGGMKVMLGNHDAWLGDFYRTALGAEIIEAPTCDVACDGIRLHLAHGHRLGARSAWKGVMEGRAFASSFRLLPAPVASNLEWMLDRSNDLTRRADDRRHLDQFRRYADNHAKDADIVVLGHLHQRVDDNSRPPRLIVLGDWKHQASYLRVDPTGAHFQIVQGPSDGPSNTAVRSP